MWNMPRIVMMSRCHDLTMCMKRNYSDYSVYILQSNSHIVHNDNTNGRDHKNRYDITNTINSHVISIFFIHDDYMTISPILQSPPCQACVKLAT